MKRLLTILLLLLIVISLCACNDDRDRVETYHSSQLHTERHYKDGSLFYEKEVNVTTGITTHTYFYWEWDAHGRASIKGTEIMTVNKDGETITSKYLPSN